MVVDLYYVMKTTVDMHIEADAVCMVIIVFLSYGRTKIQTSKDGSWVLNSDTLFLSFLSGVRSQHLDPTYMWKELIYMFTWHVVTVQPMLASAIIWFKALLPILHVSWEVVHVIKMQFGWSPYRGHAPSEGGYLGVHLSPRKL